MSDQAMLGYVIHFAHDAGSKGRLVTPELVEEILAEAARHVARKEIRAYRNAESAAESPSTDEDDLQALLAIRNGGAMTQFDIAGAMGWSPDRAKSSLLRLCAPGYIEAYVGRFHTITDKGRDRLRKAGLV